MAKIHQTAIVEDGAVLVAGVDPGSHGHDGFHRGLAGQVFLIVFGALHALTGGEVTGLVGPVQVDFGAGHELQQLPRSVLLRLRGPLQRPRPR